MLTTIEPIVDFCKLLFNGRSLFSSPIVNSQLTAMQKLKLMNANNTIAVHLSALPLPTTVDTLATIAAEYPGELAYTNNKLINYRAMLQLSIYDAMVVELKLKFPMFSEDTIINTMNAYIHRLGIREQLLQYARNRLLINETL